MRAPNVFNLAKHANLKQIEASLAQAKHYQRWHALATEHDRLTGKTQWRAREETRLYDYAEIRRRKTRIEALLNSGDTKGLLRHLNEGVHGNMGGMGDSRLYHRSKVGTKHLIENYLDLLSNAFEHIGEDPKQLLNDWEKTDFFRRASHCYGRSALMLSGGAGLIYFHHGVIAELAEHGCLPNVISGASAGSWISVQVGSHTDEELAQGYFDRQRYPSLSGKELWSSLTDRSGVESAAFREALIDSFCSKMTFQEAYEHTGRYINISVAPVERHQKPRLLNAITSPDVTLRSAAMASSAVPGMIDAVQLECKDGHGRLIPYLPTRRWVDGSMVHDLPAKQLARLYGVNHYLVSLINPLALPFTIEPALHRNNIYSAARRFFYNTSLDSLKLSQSALEKTGRAQTLNNLLTVGHRLLDQQYTGDINLILPRSDYRSGNTLFVYEDNDIDTLILAGRRSVWPRLAQIRNSLRPSQQLDELLIKFDQPSGLLRYMIR